MGKFKLEEVKFIDTYNFQMIEGKFLDLEQAHYQGKRVYVYANISNSEKRIEESDVRYYSQSFENLYCAEDYELHNFSNYDEEIKKELINSSVYKERFDNKGKINKLINKIRELNVCWYEAVLLFDSIDDCIEEDWKHNSGFPTEYPFEQSFDEYPLQISAWIAAMEKTIK